MANFRVTRPWRAIFHYMPFILLLARWLVFWILETALIQFYDDTLGQQARNKAVTRSRNYVQNAAPGNQDPTRTIEGLKLT